MRTKRPAALVLPIIAALAAAMAPASTARAAPPGPERAALTTISVPSQAAFTRLITSGADIAGHVRRQADGSVQVDVVATPSRLKALEGIGATPAPAKAPAPRVPKPIATDRIEIERAVWFQQGGQFFLSVEATSSAGADAALTAAWRGSGGTSGQAPLVPSVDAGTYMGHQMTTPVPTDGRATTVTVTSQGDGTATARTGRWPVGKPPQETVPGYQKDFITEYLAPDAIYERINRLHKEFPKLTDLIDLPNKTNGYRRHAQAVLGEPPSAAIVVTSRRYGTEGGNDLQIELTDPGSPNSPLTVTVDGKTISVGLATDADGRPASTAADVVSAINDRAGELVGASTYRGDAGGGVMGPAPVTQLDDFLDAPDGVARQPYQVQALRLGVHRDGSRTGVLAYSQEHAREWVTPLVAIEAAERLLRNYRRDPGTRKLLRTTDLFVIPSVNPDGANYSFYDFNFQRRNMTNHCPPQQSDPGLRDRWGVDVNRNYAAGSLFDGYFGASTNCNSDVFAGPGEHSEPESSNVIEVAKRYPNIRFAMNIHSYGGYFMWPPGAYKLDGRVTLPRPTPEEEDFFWEAAGTIERAIASERGTVTWPQQTGPVTDVLYSAAGNSADELWYDYGIFGWDFEVGNDLWNPATRQWEAVGFQPPFAEGHEEAMEYATGLISLIRVASEYNR